MQKVSILLLNDWKLGNTKTNWLELKNTAVTNTPDWWNAY
ncbi:hypothetical protein YMSE1_05550 [Lactiplantibacillus plantarum]